MFKITKTTKLKSTALILKEFKYRAEQAKNANLKRDTSTGKEHEYQIIKKAVAMGYNLVRYAPRRGRNSPILSKEEIKIIHDLSYINLSENDRDGLLVVNFPFENDYTESTGFTEFAIIEDGECVQRIEAKFQNVSGSVIEKMEAHARRLEHNTYPENAVTYIMGGRYFTHVRIELHRRQLQKAAPWKRVLVIHIDDLKNETVRDEIFPEVGGW